MPHQSLVKRSLNLLLKRQTNILSAAFVIMGTVILSQLLGLIRQRLLFSIFGPSNTVGVYLAAQKLPDLLFQIVIAAALSSAFIPVFSGYLAKHEDEEANRLASNLLTIGLLIFSVLACILALFAPFFVHVLNPGEGFSPPDIALMVNLMRLIIFGQLLFIVGSFFAALLQSHNHFFIPGFAAALYNLGILIGIILLSPMLGIYSAAVGIFIGASLFILIQLPLVKRVGFHYVPRFEFTSPGVQKVSHLMWPRTLSLAVFQMGSIFIVSLVSFLASAGRNYVIFDSAQTIAFAPVALIGQAIAQAAFPILSREKDNPQNFRLTFMTSFNQMLYLILPLSALLLVLRIPIVRLVYGASKFDWPATVLTGQTLAFFSISIFAQALIALVARGFYALHNTKIPLIVGTISTILMLALAYLFIIIFKMNVASLAIAYSVASIIQLVAMFLLLEKMVGSFNKTTTIITFSKYFIATLFTAVALYIPLKILDKLVFDTTRTFNLILLTGISSLIGISLYFLMTWLLDVPETRAYLALLQKYGNWREILGKSEEAIEGTRL